MAEETNNGYQFKGKIAEIGNIRIVGSRGFEMRDVVIEYTGKFDDRTQYVKFTFSGKHVHDPEQFSVGNLVTVYFNIGGRKWEKDGKVSYFTDLSGWKIVGNASQVSSNVTSPATPPAEYEPTEDDMEDIPF